MSPTTPVPSGVGSRPSSGGLSAFKHREFRIFWFAALISNTGAWMQNAAIPYVAFQLTGLDSGVGVTGFFQYLPIMLMGAVGGSLADRYDRKIVLFLTQLAQAGFAILLWILVSSGNATPFSLSVLAFGSGLASGMNIPVWQAFVSQLVPRDVLLNAVTLNSTQFNGARAIGTFLAGVIIAAWGPDLAFAINAITFIAVLGGLAMIPAKGRPVSDNPRKGAIAEWVEGVRYVAGVPGIVSCCLAIIVVASMASPLFSFLTASYGQEIFDVSGWQAGLLWSAGGAGSVLLAPVILTKGAKLSRTRLLTISMTTYGIGTIVVGLSPNWIWAAGGMAVYGASYLAIASALNTTIQLLARDDMRGKSVAVYIVCLTGALPLGLILWGIAADQFGIRPVTITAGLVMIVSTFLFSVSGRFEAMNTAK